MTTSSYMPNGQADIATLLHALAEAADSRVFFATLCRALPTLFPHTRVDLLISDWSNGLCLPLVSDQGALPAPSDAGHNADAFAAWLADCGYAAVAMQPLNGAGRHLGWLVLARRTVPIDEGVQAFAGQIAAVTALRLLHEYWRDELALRDDTIAILERRLYEHEDMRLRATLAVGTAHDIGNLLASVVGHAQMMQREAPAELQPDLQTIIRAARDGNTLLRRLIALKSTGLATQEGQVVAMSSLVRDALALTRPFWDNRPDIEIQTEMPGLPPVRAHAADMREILVNLIINAISVMPSGGLLVISSRCEDNYGIIEVTDTGQGIPAEYQARIFQPLTSTKEGGHGLGLSVSRTLAESYGGTLTVESTPGEGATFMLAVPLARPSEVALKEAWAPSTAHLTR
ncbi:MAG TPA: HAMP domain-containing sensor histidine kinase [Kouleothrix sp.]|nr:HAMP domain-containing sensor histidine kinase [Kouleothrix sp.]